LNHNIPISNRNYPVVLNATKDIMFSRSCSRYFKAQSLPSLFNGDLNTNEKIIKAKEIQTGKSNVICLVE